jgi:glutaredoxin
MGSIPTTAGHLDTLGTMKELFRAEVQKKVRSVEESRRAAREAPLLSPSAGSRGSQGAQAFAGRGRGHAATPPPSPVAAGGRRGWGNELASSRSYPFAAEEFWLDMLPAVYGVARDVLIPWLFHQRKRLVGQLARDVVNFVGSGGGSVVSGAQAHSIIAARSINRDYASCVSAVGTLRQHAAKVRQLFHSERAMMRALASCGVYESARAESALPLLEQWHQLIASFTSFKDQAATVRTASFAARLRAVRLWSARMPQMVEVCRCQADAFAKLGLPPCWAGEPLTLLLQLIHELAQEVTNRYMDAAAGCAQHGGGAEVARLRLHSSPSPRLRAHSTPSPTCSMEKGTDAAAGDAGPSFRNLVGMLESLPPGALVSELLSEPEGCGLDRLGDDGWSVLHHAVQRNMVGHVAALLDGGATRTSCRARASVHRRTRCSCTLATLHSREHYKRGLTALDIVQLGDEAQRQRSGTGPSSEETQAALESAQRARVQIRAMLQLRTECVPQLLGQLRGLLDCCATLDLAPTRPTDQATAVTSTLTAPAAFFEELRALREEAATPAVQSPRSAAAREAARTTQKSEQKIAAFRVQLRRALESYFALLRAPGGPARPEADMTAWLVTRAERAVAVRMRSDRLEDELDFAHRIRRTLEDTVQGSAAIVSAGMMALSEQLLRDARVMCSQLLSAEHTAADHESKVLPLIALLEEEDWCGWQRVMNMPHAACVSLFEKLHTRRAAATTGWSDNGWQAIGDAAASPLQPAKACQRCWLARRRDAREQCGVLVRSTVEFARLSCERDLLLATLYEIPRSTMCGADGRCSEQLSLVGRLAFSKHRAVRLRVVNSTKQASTMRDADRQSCARRDGHTDGFATAECAPQSSGRDPGGGQCPPKTSSASVMAPPQASRRKNLDTAPSSFYSELQSHAAAQKLSLSHRPASPDGVLPRPPPSTDSNMSTGSIGSEHSRSSVASELSVGSEQSLESANSDFDHHDRRHESNLLPARRNIGDRLSPLGPSGQLPLARVSAPSVLDLLAKPTMTAAEIQEQLKRRRKEEAKRAKRQAKEAKKYAKHARKKQSDNGVGSPGLFPGGVSPHQFNAGRVSLVRQMELADAAFDEDAAQERTRPGGGDGIAHLSAKLQHALVIPKPQTKPPSPDSVGVSHGSQADDHGVEVSAAVRPEIASRRAGAKRRSWDAGMGSSGSGAHVRELLAIVPDTIEKASAGSLKASSTAVSAMIQLSTWARRAVEAHTDGYVLLLNIDDATRAVVDSKLDVQDADEVVTVDSGALGDFNVPDGCAKLVSYSPIALLQHRTDFESLLEGLPHTLMCERDAVQQRTRRHVDFVRRSMLIMSRHLEQQISRLCQPQDLANKLHRVEEPAKSFFVLACNLVTQVTQMDVDWLNYDELVKRHDQLCRHVSALDEALRSNGKQHVKPSEGSLSSVDHVDSPGDTEVVGVAQDPSTKVSTLGADASGSIVPPLGNFVEEGLPPSGISVDSPPDMFATRRAERTWLAQSSSAVHDRIGRMVEHGEWEHAMTAAEQNGSADPLIRSEVRLLQENLIGRVISSGILVERTMGREHVLQQADTFVDPSPAPAETTERDAGAEDVDAKAGAAAGSGEGLAPAEALEFEQGSFLSQRGLKHSCITICTTSQSWLKETLSDCRYVREVLSAEAHGIDIQEFDMAHKSKLALRTDKWLLSHFSNGLKLPLVFFGKTKIGGVEKIKELHDAGKIKSALQVFVHSVLSFVRETIVCIDIMFDLRNA